MPPYVTNRKGAEIGEQVESMVDDDLVRRRELLATVNPPVYPQWCQSVKEQLGMRQAADVRTLGLNSLYFIFTACAWVSHDYTGTLGMLFWIAVCAWWGFIGACTVHNTMHCKVFKDSWHNKMWQAALSLTYGHPVSSYVPGHNLSHHKYTQRPKDIMRTTKLKYKWHLLNGLFFQQHVAGAVMVNDLKYSVVQSKINPTFFQNIIREFTVVLSVQLVLGLMDWRRMLLYFWVPHLFAQWAIVSINIVQHDGCDNTSNGEVTSGDKVKNMNLARNLTSPILNWFLLNNGYHTIHHIYPNMHWSHYPDAHQKIVVPYMDKRLDQPCLTTYIFKTFVSPGIRTTYDGHALVVPDEEPEDCDWISYPESMPKTKVMETLAPSNLAYNVAAYAIVLPFKMLSPMWSPSGPTI